MSKNREQGNSSFKRAWWEFKIEDERGKFMYLLRGSMGRKCKESLLLPRLTDCNKPTFSTLD